MADENHQEGIPPFFEFPFVFIPPPMSDEATTEDSKDENTENDEEKNDLRISQPEYSDLLKQLDFTFKRTLDVTDLLINQNSREIPDEIKTISPSTSSRSSTSGDNEEIRPPTAGNEIQNELNHLAAIIQEQSQISPEKKSHAEEDDDTSRQATQNYDLHDNENGIHGGEDAQVRLTTQQSNSSQDENLSSIPRLHPQQPTPRREEPITVEEHPITWENLIHGSDGFMQPGTFLIISPRINESPTTPTKSPKRENLPSHRTRHLSSSSETDSVIEPALQRSRVKSFPAYQHETSEISVDDDLNDFNVHLRQALDQDQPVSTDHTSDRAYTTTASDILYQNQSTKKKSSRQNEQEDQQSKSKMTNDDWLAMLEKLEQEHRERLEQQQKQYEEHMQRLEEKMKRRFDEYLSTTTLSFQDSDRTAPSELISQRQRTYSNSHQYRPLAKDLINHYYPSHSASHLSNLGTSSSMTNLSRSQSRDDISSLRIELSAKHAKHVADLKLYYEHEIEDLKNQLTRNRMGHTTSTTRQSIETIERINQENIRLHDEVKQLRHSIKSIQDENNSLNRKFDELRAQLNNKEIELKNSHRLIADLQQEITEAHHLKERQDERFRQADRQALLYREENEKLKKDLNSARERLFHPEDRHQENGNRSFRQDRTSEEAKMNSTMSMNVPTSREYGRFTMTTSRYSSSTITSPRDGIYETGRFTTNGSDDFLHHNHSPRPLTRINDYIHEKPSFPQAYVPPARPRPLFSSQRSPPGRNQVDPMPDLIDDPIRQGERLEEKFDDLLRKKRDLEARINRIPTRGLTSTDRQLLETLEHQIDRVEQQISSVKLELRKMNILRTH